MGTRQSGTRVLQGAELQLLHCALAASQGLRDFTDTFLLGETHPDNTPLIGGQLLHQQEEAGGLIGLNQPGLRARVGKIRQILLAGTLSGSAF
jgi:hypothetical protein